MAMQVLKRKEDIRPVKFGVKIAASMSARIDAADQEAKAAGFEIDWNEAVSAALENLLRSAETELVGIRKKVGEEPKTEQKDPQTQQ